MKPNLKKCDEKKYPKIKKRSHQARMVSIGMKKHWADPVKKAALCERMRQSALKRKYSAAGFASLQKHMREKVNTPEHYKSEAYLKRVIKGSKNKSRGVKKGKRPIIIKRPNDFCGVLTETEMVTM